MFYCNKDKVDFLGDLATYCIDSVTAMRLYLDARIQLIRPWPIYLVRYLLNSSTYHGYQLLRYIIS